MEGSADQPLHVTVDENLCAASATCKRIAPQVFDLSDDADTAIVLQTPVTDPAQIALTEEAEESCPTMAILLKRG